MGLSKEAQKEGSESQGAHLEASSEHLGGSEASPGALRSEFNAVTDSSAIAVLSACGRAQGCFESVQEEPRRLKLRARDALGASKMGPKMSLKKFNFFLIFFLNSDEARVAPWAADMAKVSLPAMNP